MQNRRIMRAQIFRTRRLASHALRSTRILNHQLASLVINKVMGRIASWPLTLERKGSRSKHVSSVQRHTVKPLANSYPRDHTVFVVKGISHP